MDGQSTVVQSILHICCYLLMNSSFTTFLFSLPISHFLISLFLVFSLLLIFNLILELAKEKCSECFSTYHTSHITHIHAVYSINQCDLSGYIFCQVIYRQPCECPYVDTMFLLQLHLFPMQNLPFIFNYHLFCCECCGHHMLDLNRSLFLL
jgi:hypothetical protein